MRALLCLSTVVGDEVAKTGGRWFDEQTCSGRFAGVLCGFLWPMAVAVPFFYPSIVHLSMK